jgi:CSLREA domain-containing protein
LSTGPGLVAPLEAALITVNTLADVVNGFDGLCSLREAIIASNANAASGPAAGECAAGSAFPVRDIVNFSVAGTITPAAANGPLPTLTEGRLTINGWSAPGAGPGRRPRIVLNGALLGFDNGLAINSAENHVRGLAIVSFANFGILIWGTESIGNRVYGNVIGANPAGTLAVPNGSGILIVDGATENIVGTDGDGVRDAAELNVISGNLGAGVAISSLGTDRNRVAGNRIGTSTRGTAALPNGANGVDISALVVDTVIGTDSQGVAAGDAVEGNLISGNGLAGVSTAGGTVNTVIAGNIIGLNAAGNTAIPNLVGVLVDESEVGVRIGTNGDGLSDDFERNVVSGNTSTGIDVRGLDHLVAGNYVGTDIGGSIAIPNAVVGVSAGIGALGIGANITIGGADMRFRNVISGNGGTGVQIIAADVTVECNHIGTDAAGAIALGNVIGVNVTSGVNALVRHNRVSFNEVGAGSSQDTTVVNDNIIAGNTANGFSWLGAGLVDVTNNWWGDASGPTHASNPGGIGDAILELGGGTALYNPFLAVEPVLCDVQP